jgi:hypothetical protein
MVDGDSPWPGTRLNKDRLLLSSKGERFLFLLLRVRPRDGLDYCRSGACECDVGNSVTTTRRGKVLDVSKITAQITCGERTSKQGFLSDMIRFPTT